MDLGLPLPDSPHACSVCLPTWDSIVGYEEGRQKVVTRMRTGYPRFFKHPVVERLFAKAKAEVASDQEDVIVLPTRAAVQRAHRWVERQAETAVRITSFHGLQVLIVPAKAKATADAYWRFAGEVVSSRQAQDFLDGNLREGNKSHLISRALSKYTGAAPEDTFIFTSGMAAVTAVLRALPGLHEGKKTLQMEFPYVDSLKVQELFGHGVVYLNDATGESFDEALMRIRQGEFAGVFTEIPSNPLLRTVDLHRVAKACEDGNTPLIVDDSAAGPYNVDSLKYADVVTGSLTKWISGEGDIMAGAASVRASSPVANALRESLRADSTDSSPLYIGDAEVLLSNMRGYTKRMETVNANGTALASWLAAHPAVAEVWHPSLTQKENYDKVMRPGGGYGGLLSFVLKNQKKTPKVYDALRVSKGPSFGTYFTLVCPYTLLAHYTELEWAEGCGVSANLLRVSTGLEPIGHLLAVFEEALAYG
ncbi:PLP-dependent transferase [Luteolibacter yonseiensis]|uniref:PLP-dependent transferase n=1 Tax=Luteolibacter yonseiensis TaxID=1144680 RepID=A0A934QZU4_9BACT|nr:PLP-dependent transferase [Luteolibacter yonseiensis]